MKWVGFRYQNAVYTGVGVKIKPRSYLKSGQTVTVEIEKIGKLTNPVIEEPDELLS